MQEIVNKANQSGKPLMLIIDDTPNRISAKSRFFKKPIWTIALFEKKFFKTVKNEFYVYYALSSNQAVKEILAYKATPDYPAYFFFNSKGEIIYQNSGISDQKEKYIKMLENAKLALDSQSI
ncbi:hypothetical protein GCM10022289_36720 [Pedobacter jeongneungensis]|uniref:Alkyl hydroperoxide reductase subunit C/ Thiol specific antioxidant domain-containing protein n=2 Tax=Pedobacter jeongneungensis TaxID=947309 RepID=A0ABP8BM04_9SPHI